MMPTRAWLIELLDRMVRAAMLDASLYEEAEADSTFTEQALAVVLLSALAAGIGGASRGAVLLVVAALVGWYVWAAVTFWIGTKLFPEPDTRADLGQLLRTVGFASAPGIVRLLGVVPGLTSLAFALAQVWMLAAMVIAVRRALDYSSTWRAVGVIAIGWLAHTVVMLILIDVWRA